MEQLKQFVELLFQDLPDGEEAELAKSAVLKKLEVDYEQYLRDGMYPEQALTQTLICFGALESAEREFQHQRLLHTYHRFRQRYPLMLRCGYLGILVLPLLFLVLFTALDAKLISLIGWGASLAGLVTFIICVEYRDYRFKRQLGITSDVARECQKKPAVYKAPENSVLVKEEQQLGGRQ